MAKRSMQAIYDEDDSGSPRIRIKDLDLSGSVLRQMSIPCSVIENCDLRRATILDSDLRGVEFVNCELEGLEIRRCHIHGLSGTDSQPGSVRFVQCELRPFYD
ncbi:MAG: pentapeptide repeat-containing protein [Phycisphaeraceae bacterium]|nr:pentapeptide repeat-containing protein [Phycisphaeraceae bacterium]MCB9848142.1 pentapeptide repeat-containing protein [Phycisphaeraceae bacterium]